MARLRVRVELNRGGVGVPLHKLSSIAGEAEKFFQMLAEDVHIETNRGEWLAFDFDHESLNFTAEFVGPVSPEQVRAFDAAFDGTTPLRRSTISQFTRITEAIGQDELIGFGLYHADESEPSEWRCLSRRDALRIADEIQVLLGASGERDQETRLPAVIDHDTGARLFKERHDRGMAMEPSNMPELIREVEASLSKRVARLEGQVDEHSGAIHELRETSGAAEESFRNLLSSVESFCSQATRKLERISTPSQAPQLTAPAKAAIAARPWTYAIAAVVIFGAVAAVVLMWSPKSGEAVQSRVSAASPPAAAEGVRQPAPAVEHTAAPVPLKPAPSKPPAAAVATVEHAAKLAARDSTVMHVDIEAREPAWVAVTDADGKRLLAKTLEANETHSLELTSGAILRTGNAGGLVVRFNGKEIGPLGPTGKVRDISFKNGSYKVHAPAPDAG